MSRNFELLAQLETELETKIVRTSPLLDRRAARVIDRVISDDPFQDEMLRLVHRVFLSANGSAPRQVVFCGVESGNGSTSVCANAARTLAASVSQSVCVIDGNLRSPRVADALGIADGIPIFNESTSKNDGCIQIGSNLWFGGIDVLTRDNGAFPSMDQLKERLIKLRDIFEFVLIDAPGTNVSEDASKLGQLADAAILVIDANRTRRLTARISMETLESSGVKLLGTVLTSRTYPIPELLYHRL